MRQVVHSRSCFSDRGPHCSRVVGSAPELTRHQNRRRGRRVLHEATKFRRSCQVPRPRPARGPCPGRGSGRRARRRCLGRPRDIRSRRSRCSNGLGVAKTLQRPDVDDGITLREDEEEECARGRHVHAPQPPQRRHPRPLIIAPEGFAGDEFHVLVGVLGDPAPAAGRLPLAYGDQLLPGITATVADPLSDLEALPVVTRVGESCGQLLDSPGGKAESEIGGRQNSGPRRPGLTRHSRRRRRAR